MRHLPKVDAVSALAQAKAFERRVAQALGGRRAGNTGASHSDIVGTPWSVECKYSSRGCVLARWLAQARRQSKVERRPYLLVVTEHYQALTAATVTLPFGEFHRIATLANQIPNQSQNPALTDGP